MMKTQEARSTASPVAIHVAERGIRTRSGAWRCEIGENVEFSTESLESYFFARWEPVAYDALLVAAAVEFADRSRRRPAYTWQREFELRIPVHDTNRWNDPKVGEALRDSLGFLTGDRWHFEFYGRKKVMNAPQQTNLILPAGVEAVIPFSNGLDSRAVA